MRYDECVLCVVNLQAIESAVSKSHHSPETKETFSSTIERFIHTNQDEVQRIETELG